MRISVQEAYVALGLPYGAPESDCRRAYRRLISAWHPDRNASPEAHEKTLHFNGAIKSLGRDKLTALKRLPLRLICCACCSVSTLKRWAIKSESTTASAFTKRACCI